MKIKYCNTMDDLLAFNQFHWSKSPQEQKDRRRAMIRIPILLVVAMTLIFLIDKEVEILIIGFCILAIWISYIYLYYTKFNPQRVKKIYEEGNNKTLFCEHTLETVNEGLVSASEYGEAKMKWNGILKIESERNYTYVYTSSAAAIIIPELRITEGDYKKFVQELHERITPPQNEPDLEPLHTF